MTYSPLAAALAAADEASLSAISSRGLYKRACKDTEGLAVNYNELDGEAALDLFGEHCIIRAPLEKSVCTCPSRAVCRHILSAVLLLKKSLPADAVPPPEPPSAPEPAPELLQEEDAPQLLSGGELSAVHDSAESALSTLAGLLARGLVRADPSAADELELAAVRAHAAKMADAERALRTLSGKLSDCTARRASFDAADFTRRLGSCVSMLVSLQSDEIAPEQLGSFRSSYVPYPGELDLLPVGTQDIYGGDFNGTVYYFLNTDIGAYPRILTYSDLRPTFYGHSGRVRSQTMIWGLSNSLKTMMKKRMTLKDAGICGDKLSGSNVTTVIRSRDALLDCPELRAAVITDCRELVYAAAEGTERTFLVHIHELVSFGFDKYAQTFNMVIRDIGGRTAEVSVRYREESAEFIGKLEEYCKGMKGSKDAHTVLASARLDQGKLRLSPIELYDNISPFGWHKFTPPERLDRADAPHAAELLRLTDDLTDELVRTVRSGLGTALTKPGGLIERLRRCGLFTLADLAEGYFDTAESYRHTLTAGAGKPLIKLSELTEYISLAEKKLGVISAVYKMEE